MRVESDEGWANAPGAEEAWPANEEAFKATTRICLPLLVDPCDVGEEPGRIGIQPRTISKLEAIDFAGVKS